MNKVSNWIQKHILPKANRISQQKYLMNLQSVFMSLIPFMTIGSFALILISPPYDYTLLDPGFLKTFLQGWTNFANVAGGVFEPIFIATMDHLALWVAIGIAFFLSRYYKLQGYVPIIVVGVSFIVVNGTGLEGSTSAFYGGAGLFSGIIVSITAIEMYRFLINKEVGKIDIPGAGVPPAIVEGFASLVPAAIISLFFGILSSFSITVLNTPFPNIMTIFVTPIISMMDSLLGVTILSLVILLLWFFGIHDTAITGITSPFMKMTYAANIAAFSAGVAANQLPYTLTDPFWWTFVAGIGGTGASMGLALMLLFSKSKHLKTVGKLAVIPTLFNVNEPIIFGVPIMMNPTFFIPHMTAMTLNAIITYVCMNVGLVNKPFAYGGWNMPFPIAAFVATLDWRAVVLVFGLLALNMLIFLPFLRIYDKQKLAEESLVLEEEL